MEDIPGKLFVGDGELHLPLPPVAGAIGVEQAS